ncbi:hypothetical protein BBK14_27550 [Parafrankia soli]|uniref:Uncharacterized protein n=1 Tax=Parafrankia soli TaxID=2599596 RepID=A0A1S1PHX4_9ACTN|nr:hypothetical protein BBK14_27550 [Parafrankia soli]
MGAVTAPVTADRSSWEFDAGELPDLWPEPRDSLIVGLLPEPRRPGSDRQDMLLCDLMPVDTDVMVGASIGVAQLATVGLVMLHRRFTALRETRVAWAVGARLRRERLAAGEIPRIVMTGSYPTDDMIPDGVTFSGYRVRLRDHEFTSMIDVWEVRFPALV